jgi:two-component system, OmpR family, alkaline phosphatase synthesis response regulator PhoP
MHRKILLVEDEPGLRMTLVDRLQKEGYVVETAATGDDGYRRGLEESFDLFVLDIMLPDRNGLDLCRDLRHQGIAAPILMLTARDQTVDKVLGLKLGADDYLTKPFEMLELLARIEALLRRAYAIAPASGAYQFGSVRVDFRRAEVTRGQEKVDLAAKEFQLLRYFLEHRGEALTREQMLKDVWGYHAATSTRTVDVHVSWLRQKLEDDPRQPRWILTIHGIGYKFEG